MADVVHLRPRTRRLADFAQAQAHDAAVQLTLTSSDGTEHEVWLSPTQARFWAESIRQLAETAEESGIE